MNLRLKQRIAELLTDGIATGSRVEIEAEYPARSLASGAEVTRFCPSPTGFVHIGSVYTALLCQFLAHQSEGVYILRIEDTDKNREVVGATKLIADQLAEFELSPDEGLQKSGQEFGNYGPYLQSARQGLYLCYALELLDKDRAYPCFASPEELANSVKDQQTKKLRPGYYGQWALWRNKSDDEITSALDAKKPFVLRLKSNGSHDKRVGFSDVLKGKMELPENDLDVPLIKSDGSRLPTYHLAHVVDDHLMKPTIILRGDEWLPSTALHLELAAALSVGPFRYAHTAPISIIDKNGGGKRKLSKRKDPEADVRFWLKAGYPIPAIKAYLLGLANSNFEDWYREHAGEPLESFPLSLEKLAASRAPLLDTAKLEDYCKDYIASLPQADFERSVLGVASGAFKAALQADPGYASKVLSIERGGGKPRKDLSRWGAAAGVYGYFFDELFEADFKNQIADLLIDIPADVQKHATKEFLKTYSASDDQAAWFDKLKAAAEACNFATDNKAFKANPENFKGNLADFARILRVKLTGKNQTPDLWTMMSVMGHERVKRRLVGGFD